jgi:hypothetical protein
MPRDFTNCQGFLRSTEEFEVKISRKAYITSYYANIYWCEEREFTSLDVAISYFIVIADVITLEEINLWFTTRCAPKDNKTAAGSVIMTRIRTDYTLALGKSSDSEIQNFTSKFRACFEQIGVHNLASSWEQTNTPFLARNKLKNTISARHSLTRRLVLSSCVRSVPTAKRENRFLA